MIRITFALNFILLLAAGNALGQDKPALREIDRTRLAEAFRLSDQLADGLWVESKAAVKTGSVIVMIDEIVGRREDDVVAPIAIDVGHCDSIRPATDGIRHIGVEGKILSVAAERRKAGRRDDVVRRWRYTGRGALGPRIVRAHVRRARRIEIIRLAVWPDDGTTKGVDSRRRANINSC